MSASSKSGPSEAQTEMQTIADGLANSSLTLFASLVVLGSNLSKAEVVAKLRTWIALYVAAIQAKQAYAAAVASRKAIEVTARQYLASVVLYIRQIVGPNNPALLATFGIAPAKARKAASTTTKAVAQAKAAQTRKARGTMSAKARQTITAMAQPQVQIVGLAPASSTTASTPVTAPVSTVAAPAPTVAPSMATAPAAPATPGSSNLS